MESTENVDWSKFTLDETEESAPPLTEAEETPSLLVPESGETKEEQEEQGEQEEQESENPKETKEDKEEGSKKTESEEGEMPELPLPEDDDTDNPWKKLGKEIGYEYEVSEDVNTNIANIKNAIIEGEKKRVEKELEHRLEQIKDNPQEFFDIPDEAKTFLKYLHDGGDPVYYQNELAQFDKWINLSDRELVKSHLVSAKQAQGLSVDQDEIESQLERYEDRDMIEDRASEIRGNLKIMRSNKEKELAKSQATTTQELRETQRQEELKQREGYKKALSGVNEFMGFKIGEAHKDYLLGLDDKGQVQKILKDSEKVVQFMLSHAFAEQAQKELARQSKHEGREEVQEKLHNSPRVATGGATKSTDSSENNAEGFDAWKLPE